MLEAWGKKGTLVTWLHRPRTLGEMIHKTWPQRIRLGVGLSKISYFHPEHWGKSWSSLKRSYLFKWVETEPPPSHPFLGGVAIFGFRFCFLLGCFISIRCLPATEHFGFCACWNHKWTTQLPSTCSRQQRSRRVYGYWQKHQFWAESANNWGPIYQV